ncbi:hypothetical protein D3C80_1894520 [compost metagenome]
MALLAAFFMIKTAMNSTHSAIWNTIIVSVSMVAFAITMYNEIKNLHEVATIIGFNLVIFFSLFSIASSIKKLIKLMRKMCKDEIC